MNLKIQLDIFKQIDKIRDDIRALDSYDPITSIIKDKFQLNITNYLASLKVDTRTSPQEDILKSATSKGANLEDATVIQKEIYLDIGRKYASTLFMFDMVNKPISISDIQLFYEILFGSPEFRTEQVLVRTQSGDERKFMEASSVPASLTELLDWLSEHENNQEIHPLVKVTYFHYKLLSIHPFLDGNGRIARLFMNIMFMSFGYLPILIKPTDRIDYYKALEAADNDDLSPLTKFIAERQLETQTEFINSPEYLSVVAKFELENQLKKIKGKEKCFVLTEDKNYEGLLTVLFASSDFNMEETTFLSYEGCSNISSVTLFTIFANEKLPHIKIVVHRDRDYLTDEEIEKQRNDFLKIKAHFFVTNGTDVESHFANSKHINFCHSTINEEQAKKIIQESIDEVKESSIDKLRIKEFGQSHKNKFTHLDKALVDLYLNNKLRFSHGKTLYKLIKRKIQETTKVNADLEKKSVHLSSPILKQIADSIWKV